MTYETILLILGTSALGAMLAHVAYRQGVNRGRDEGYANVPAAYDRGFNAGVVSGSRGGWRAAHEVALDALTKYPTSKGGKHVVKMLAKGPVPALPASGTSGAAMDFAGRVATGSTHADGAA